MTQTAIEALRTAVHNAMIETVRMEDDSVQAWQNAVDTITERALSALTQGGVKGEPPVTPPMNKRAETTWKHVVELFQMHGLAHPPVRLRDELVCAFEWAWYGYALSRSALSTKLQEPVGWFVRMETAKKVIWHSQDSREDAERYAKSHGTYGGKAMQLYAAPPTLAHQPVTAGLEGEVKFLLDRLEDFERGMLSEDTETTYRDWCGHVHPPMARLRATLKSEGRKIPNDSITGLTGGRK